MMMGMISVLVTLVFMAAIFGVVFFVIYKKLIQPAAKARKVLQIGHPGKAKILQLQDTGTRINDNPLVLLTVEVHPSIGSPYQAQIRQVVSIVHLAQFQPGAMLAVKIDPSNPQAIAVEGFATA